MGRLSSSDLDDDFDLPEGGDDDDDDGTIGVEDAEDLLLSELRDEPEDVGLDTESAGAEGALVTQLLDIDDDESALDDGAGPLDLEDDIDAEGDEHGWTEGSEGSAGEDPWEEGLGDELGDSLGDDGGEEGVDDPLLDGLPEELQRPGALDEDNEEGVLDDSMEDLVRDIGEGA